MSEISIHRQRRGPLVLAALLFLAIMVFSGHGFLSRQYDPVDPDDHRPVDVIIPANSSARQIAVVLREKGLIRNENAFLSYCKKEHLDSRLKAGHYSFTRSQSLGAIAEAIARGAVVTMTITIPEGYTVQQIGEVLIQRKLFDRPEWEEAVNSDYAYSFLEEVSSQTDCPLEGFLFPDTYIVSEEITAREMVEHMLANFERLWKDDLSSLAAKKGMTVQEAVTLASLIEREAQVGSERKVISGVIHNRLQRGMLLQIDATVIYCLPEHKESLTYADLEIDHAYNTYRHPGLPPGPIANPGLASLEAALQPQQHNYLYYVARGNGSHEFSRTYEEHLAAKGRYID